MPVAGLPAALDTLLSSLLATEEPTSWKVEGGPGRCVVVLRFRQRDSQPLLTNDTRDYWRKKTPAQRRRDQQRASQHREKGERSHFEPFSKNNLFETDVAKSAVSAHDVDARNSCTHSPSDCVTEPPLTFDPSHSDELLQAPTVSVPSHHDSSPRETAPLHNQSAPNNEATLEDFQGMMSEITRSMTQALEEQLTAMRSEISGACAFDSVTDLDRVSPLPSTSDQSPSSAGKPTRGIRPTSPSRVHMGTSPVLPSRPADRHGDRDAASARKSERSKKPSTRQQPPRAARKT